MPGAKVKLGKDWDEGVLVITYSLLVSGTRKSVVRHGDSSAVEFALLPVPKKRNSATQVKLAAVYCLSASAYCTCSVGCLQAPYLTLHHKPACFASAS